MEVVFKDMLIAMETVWNIPLTVLCSADLAEALMTPRR